MPPRRQRISTSAQVFSDEVSGDSPPPPPTNVSSTVLHADLDKADAPDFVSDSGAHDHVTPAAFTSIFERSAAFCNHVSSIPLEHHGTRTRVTGKTAAQHRAASDFNFDCLSAQALASERAHSKPAAMQATSPFSFCHSRPAGLQASSVLAAHSASTPGSDAHACANIAASADAACSTNISPGWVLEAPPRGAAWTPYRCSCHASCLNM